MIDRGTYSWTALLVLLTLGFFLPGTVRGITLDEAYRVALEENEEILVSRERTQRARDNVTVAKSRLYPELTVSGEAVRQKELSSAFGGPTGGPTFQPEENYQYEVEYRHRLYHGGKTWFGWSLRSREAREQSFRHYRRRREILFDVARRYYDVLLSRRNLEIAERTLERSRNQLNRAQGRFDVGEVTRTSVLRAEVSVSRSEQSLEEARNELDVARQRLGLAIGRDTAPERVEDVSTASFEEDQEYYYRQAIENRWDLKQARAGKRAAAERVKWERADYFPSIDLVSQYSDADEPRFSRETENWSVSLVGSYPLFSGWRESAEVDRARSRFDAVSAQFNRMKKEIRVNIRSLYLDLESQRKVIATAEDEVESARENYEQMTAEFEEGLVSAVEVDDALKALRESESRLASTRYNYQLGILRLRLASGTFRSDLLTEDLDP